MHDVTLVFPQLPDLDRLDEIIRLSDYCNSCEVLGHTPIQQWISTGTNDLNPPLGTPITCIRCGAVLPDSPEVIYGD